MTTYNGKDKDDFIRTIKYDDGDWIIFIQAQGCYLALGNHGSHPFVHSSILTFVNSDGSTGSRLPKQLNLKQTIEYASQTAYKFIRNQIH